MNLLEQVIKDLHNRKGDWVSIAHEAGVSYSWITKLAQGKIANPGVMTIERLYLILKRAA